MVVRSAGLTDVVVYGVEIPGCEGRIGMAAIVEDLGKQSTLNLESCQLTYSHVFTCFRLRKYSGSGEDVS